MKSKSIASHGSLTFACVCRCSIGLVFASRPAIHIFDGLNVCIHATTPSTLSAELDSRKNRRMASELLSTGFHTIFTGMSLALFRSSTTALDCSATWASVSGP